MPTTGTPVSCLYSDPSATIGATPTNSSTDCNIKTRDSSAGSIYNERWLRVQITIPGSVCTTTSTDCWWSIKYTFGGVPTDRTVWVVNVLGDPVHLIN